MCLSFRASSRAMVNSGSAPFCDPFRDADNIYVYEVSFIDSWLLCRQPFKNLLLRKELRILNLLTGFGRVRWQGFGSALPEELSSLKSCTSLLLAEK
ncbi:hypothetical protein MLD38_009572 [Melastoma candidum]|nr:hypothetical protein MLD38_009572 [Melastoma candidum]